MVNLTNLTNNKYAYLYSTDATSTSDNPVFNIGASDPSSQSEFASSTATSTTNQVQSNIFNGFVLFFLSAGLLEFLLNVNKFK